MIRNLKKIEGKQIRMSPAQEINNDYYPKLINDNLGYIERQCRKACQKFNPWGYSDENDVDELFIEVIDHLKEDNFRRLRNFEGRAQLETYITTIISNLIVDLIRKKKGRSRAKERAKTFGKLSERIYELVFIKRFNDEETYEVLKTTYKVKESFNEISDIITKIKGRTPEYVKIPVDRPSGRLVKDKDSGEEELIVKDTDKNPEERLSGRQKKIISKKYLNEIISELKGEEQLIIRMMYPLADDNDPKELSGIAEKLGITEKAVDSKIRRILAKCREMMLEKGLSLDDFI